ncbi:GTPase IMAP family member 7-like, partial [Pempheris klunzingeri]|uniref:GTPase IMAP family member 7-like n=1 Tax=Pempheris klunzingeri TaxID=3127111 RepID=UPI0039816731
HHCTGLHVCYTSINGRSITLIDTPGFFDAERSEQEMNPEIVRCITECAPGPHAFLIVLRVEKFTEHEQTVIERMCQYFPAGALKHAAVVFTHGDQLPDGRKIEEYADQSDGLRDLIKNSGGRCHVIDNKYWKNSQQDEYRSNQVQVEKLLHTIDKILENNGGYYTDERLQDVERAIQKEEEGIRQSSGNMSQEEIRKQAKSKVFKKQVDKARQMWIRKLVGFAVIVGVIATISAVLISSKKVYALYERIYNLFH